MTSLRRTFTAAVAALACASTTAQAQAPAVTMVDAVTQALQRYPGVRSASEQAAAADAAASLSRTTYLPRADLVWQSNRATRNNVSGYMFPQQVIGAVTGAVSPASGASAWNHAAGALVTWEPFDFGARGATVDAAEARMRAAAAGVELTRLEVAAATAQAYLAAVATEEGRRAAQAGVERARTVFTVVDARARAGLRPGADAARAQAEVAIAETALARAEQAVQIARADLELWLGSEAQGVALAAPPSDGAASTAAHPLDASPQALRQAAEVEAAEATATAVAHSYAPRIQLEGTAFTRATGVAPDGTVGVPLQGVHNWAAGVSIAFPLFDWPAQGARRAAEQARARQEAAEYDQTLLELRAAQARARAVLQTTRRVAALSQPQLDAARSAEEQARARYAGGLGTIADVADTGRLLTDAEVNAAVSNIAVVQAAVNAAAVGGTFDSLLSAIRTLEGR